MPRIVVVVPCRNDADLLERCLHALALQQHPVAGVVVVDNASTDHTAAVALRHRAVLVSEPEIGIWPAAARGYDTALERGAEIIARLDADSRPHPDWTRRLARAFDADPRLGVLTGGAEFYGGTPLQNRLGERWYIGGGHFWIQRWLGIPLVFGSNFAMRAVTWRRVRGIVARTDARIHDDLDLTIRLRRADGVRYDPALRMPVSARPVQTVSGLAVRVGKVVTTFAVSWPEGAPWRRRDDRAESRAARRGDDRTARSGWMPDRDDLAPDAGR